MMPVFFRSIVICRFEVKNKMVNVRKRGNVYEFNFDVAKIEGKRKRITKSGFKTKAEVPKQGIILW